MNADASSNPILIDTLWPTRSTVPWLRAGALAIAGVMLLTLSAKLKVPFYPVPMTMQSFTVLVIGVAYGWRLAGATLLLYVLAGAGGFPVFAGTPEKGVGLAYMLGPTGGYLLGFIAAAMLMGFLAERGWDRNGAWLWVAMLIGHAVLFAPGVLWLAHHIGFSRAWTLGVAPFYLATLLKSALGAAIVRGAWTKYGRALRGV